MKWKNDLIKDIRFGDSRDDIDDSFGDLIELTRNKTEVFGENSPNNHKALQLAINSCLEKPKTFLEIGVCRNNSYSSTHTILKNVPTDGVYLGVDIEDKSYLNDKTRGIHTIQTSSSNYEVVVNKLNELGVVSLDFIFIDGWHSINQVLIDWEYSKLLSPAGVVAFHDTTSHPGPYYFTKFLDKTSWEVFENICPTDHGFGYCFRKRK
jgi:predicted O-methyltransferase YrrM